MLDFIIGMGINILDKIRIVDLALYFNRTLVISDVHIGYEEALNRQGVLVPRTQFGEMARRITAIIDSLKNSGIKKIIVNGDLKHEFGTVSEQEWRNTLKFIDLLSKNCDELILIKGNHDAILKPIASKRNVKVLDYLVIDPLAEKSSNGESPIPKNSLKKLKKADNILILHGDKIPSKETFQGVETIIIGHEHPAISLRDGPRTESCKCFLKGKYKGKNLIVQPSFNSMIEGTDVLMGRILSPFLQHDIGNFNVYVVEDKVYEFGKLKNLKTGKQKL